MLYGALFCLVLSLFSPYTRTHTHIKKKTFFFGKNITIIFVNKTYCNRIVFVPFITQTGHFLHLRLTPTTTIRTLKSPMFRMTKESCRLEMFTHQSGNQNGKLRIVIEPINSHDTTTASSWVPNERSGNDDRKWTEETFSIGRVSQDFRILFEVVSDGLRAQQRGHVRYVCCNKEKNNIFFLSLYLPIEIC